ncbi:MAG: hypothetical protein H6729_06995 [Deltaproteobacteria bacterium]|nr:hypothetical protein [Deltaproteobacteria bacterium]
MNESLIDWAADQRALARALGLTIEAWLDVLQAASQRRAPLGAAVIGAAARVGLSPSTALGSLEPTQLFERARALIDPRPPRVDNPVLKEAIRRADELGSGLGARRLKQRSPAAMRPRTETLERPQRGTSNLGPSSRMATADAPGEEESS